jgi:hypothetical protein
MARIDHHEKRFFEDLAAGPPPAQPEVKRPDISALRQARSIVKSLKDPHKALAKLIVGSATTNLAFAKEGSDLIDSEPNDRTTFFYKAGGIGPIGIYRLMNEHCARKWWDWEPETIWTTLSQDHGIEATEQIRNVVLSLQVILSTQQPFENWHVFEKIGQAFNMNSVDFGTLEPLELTEAALTIKILNAIRPNQEYDMEVHGYIAACARLAGVLVLPSKYFSGASNALLRALDKGEHEIVDYTIKGLSPAAQKVHDLKLEEITAYVDENWEA